MSKRQKKRLCVGLVAHVDAGKTTLSEALLYEAGIIRKVGRVDHGNSLLDNYDLERKRGITIFSKQALLEFNDTDIMLLDTPGHVDFSTEMERTLSVLDAVVLVISATDELSGHTQTLANLLDKYEIPTFIFVNKMDLPGADKDAVLLRLKKGISDSCVSFDKGDDFLESVALCDEALLERYLEGYEPKASDIGRLLAERKIFPVFFGSALLLKGVKELLVAIDTYLPMREYGEAFSATVYKIFYDEKKMRLSFLKITGGSLKVKEEIRHSVSGDDLIEKADQLRIYSGNKFTLTQEAFPGQIVAVSGLNHTYAGEKLGEQLKGPGYALAPVFTYRVCYEPPLNAQAVLKALKILEEEDPALCVSWQEQIKEIHIQLMGEIQLEILKSILKDRFDMELDFEIGNVVYKETIKSAVIGIGHYEPLRHYGEVHVLLEPGDEGSGISITSALGVDDLGAAYQKQILNSLSQKTHIGVLTGSPITDIKITLVAGRAHQKHTDGGDLRESACRAVRNGLMRAENILLEPYYSFRMELPMALVGRAMTDLQGLFAEVSGPEIDGEWAVLSGQAPVITLYDYQREFMRYTSGKGRFFMSFNGYAPCHNSEEVIEKFAYDPKADLSNSPDSVFCSHGAGYYVSWNEVHLKAHVRATEYEHLYPGTAETVAQEDVSRKEKPKPQDDPKELEEIFLRTYGVSKREKYRFMQTAREIAPKDEPPATEYKRKPEKKPQDELLIIDGYNICFAWQALRDLIEVSVDAAISSLVDIMTNYHGYTKKKILLVFDAYKIKGKKATPFLKEEPIQVIFTGEGETADMYIEKFVRKGRKNTRFTVATSDALEQLHVLSQGAIRMSARELLEEVEQVQRQIREHINDV